MEGLQARELPVVPVYNSGSPSKPLHFRAGAWSRWYEPHAPSSSHSSVFVKIICFEIQSKRKTRENNILLDVHVTKSICRSYILYAMWPVTVVTQRFHMTRNKWSVSKIKGKKV